MMKFKEERREINTTRPIYLLMSALFDAGGRYVVMPKLMRVIQDKDGETTRLEIDRLVERGVAVRRIGASHHYVAGTSLCVAATRYMYLGQDTNFDYIPLGVLIKLARTRTRQPFSTDKDKLSAVHTALANATEGMDKQGLAERTLLDDEHLTRALRIMLDYGHVEPSGAQDNPTYHLTIIARREGTLI